MQSKEVRLLPEKQKTWGGKRPGAGRKQAGETPCMTIATSVPCHIVSQAREEAERRGISLSKLVSEALEAYLRGQA